MFPAFSSVMVRLSKHFINFISIFSSCHQVTSLLFISTSKPQPLMWEQTASDCSAIYFEKWNPQFHPYCQLTWDNDHNYWIYYLSGAPMKKKKKLDPMIIKASIDRSVRKIEKRIRQQKRFARKLKPIDEFDLHRDVPKNAPWVTTGYKLQTVIFGFFSGCWYCLWLCTPWEMRR